jgi:hypothetical protein
VPPPLPMRELPAVNELAALVPSFDRPYRHWWGRSSIREPAVARLGPPNGASTNQTGANVNFLNDHYVVKFTNDAVNSLNFQLCDMDVANTMGASDAQVLAQIIAYFAAQATESAAQNTRLADVIFYPAGTNFGLHPSFPATEFTAIHTEYSSIPNLTAYGQNVGRSGEALAPLGTSIVVTEYSATGGPGGRGRHFLPFISENLINSGGQVESTAIAAIEPNYGRFLMDNPAGTSITDLTPTVVKADQSVNAPVVAVKCQPVFSNLRSRRR